ncbi:hypothetical protein [Chishuiella sp.]|uniref:hypothetical protein n=1 Tax=Chishuiella sp. TaxID=1969467 RepID=UPI0028AA753C|nr:hypothetical protein [Chishuiella sp.]
MKIKFLFLLCLIYFNSFGQKVINDEVTSFEINDKNQKIEFIVYDNKLEEKKSILLWCQGSLPYPIYVNTNDGYWLIGGGTTNFDIEYIKKYYHLVVISMPETPLIVNENEINDSYWYFGNSKDKNTPSIEFQNADYLDNYVNRAIKVLKYLKKQNWVDSKKIVVAGHSQGSKVATKIAKQYKHVSKLGLFSPNPFGRIDQNIRAYRKRAENKEINWETASDNIEKEYQIYYDSFDEAKRKKSPYLIAWNSFSVPLIDDWLTFNKPIYIAYGTNDIASELCDLVPLYFIREKKENLTYKRYLNSEHNFFQIDENGKPDHRNPKWVEVMNNFIDWSLK